MKKERTAYGQNSAILGGEREGIVIGIKRNGRAKSLEKGI